MPISQCANCGTKLRWPEGASLYRCPRCRALGSSVGSDEGFAAVRRSRSRPPLKTWRIFFNDGWAGMAVFLGFLCLIGGVVPQFDPTQEYKPAFIAFAMTTTLVAALVIALRIRRFRRLFSRGIVLCPRVRIHNRTETHVAGVHTLSSLLYEYEFNDEHYQHTLPYSAGTPFWRKVGRRFRGNRMDVSTWLLALDDGDLIDIILSESAPRKSYIVTLFAGTTWVNGLRR